MSKFRRQLMFQHAIPPAPILPYDNVVEWVFSDGFQWIELPIYGSEVTDAIEFDTKLEVYEKQQRFCSPSVGAAVFTIYVNGNNKLGVSRNGNWTGDVGTLNTSRHKFKVDHKNGKITFDSTDYTLSGESSLVSETHVTLFKTVSTSNPPFKGRIYGVKFWRNDVLMYDLIPVVKDGIGYMYDTVGGEMFENKGSGNFLVPSNKVGVSATDYIQNGLAFMWDGIENGGYGIHTTDSTMMKELINDGQATIDAAFTWSSAQSSLSATITDKGIYSIRNKFACITFPFGQDLGTSYSVELVQTVEETRSTNVANSVNFVPFNEGFAIHHYNGTYRIKGTNQSEWNTNISVVAGFNHIMFVQSSNNRGVFYINGMPVARASTNFSISLSTSQPKIGFSTSGHKGTIHAFRIYNRSLTAEESRQNSDIDYLRFRL